MKTILTLLTVIACLFIGTEGQSCPPGDWVAFNNRCFLFRVNSNHDYGSWLYAERSCRMLADMATLASIHSPEENEFIHQTSLEMMEDMKSHIWIGLEKSVWEANYPYVWRDKSNVNYVNWDSNEPNDIDGSQNCGRMYEFNGKWDDYDCAGQVTEEKHGYVCQADSVSAEDSAVIVPSLPAVGGCCKAGDVFAIIFGIIIAIQIVLVVLGYLYFYKWDKKFPWQTTNN